MDLIRLCLLCAIVSVAYGDVPAEQSVHVSHKIMDNVFVSGKEARFLFAVRNEWIQPITVFGISGAYYHETDNMIFRNISLERKWDSVPMGEEKTIEYLLRPEMEACTLRMVLQIDFTDASESKWYHVPAFNQTVTIFDPPASYLDMESVFIYALLGAIALGILSLTQGKKSRFSSVVSLSNTLRTSFSSFGKSPGSRSSITSRVPSVSSGLSDWIPAQHTRQDSKNK